MKDLSKKITIDGVEIYPLERIIQEIVILGKIQFIELERFGWQGQTWCYTFKKYNYNDGSLNEKFTYEFSVFKDYEMSLYEIYLEEFDDKTATRRADKIEIKNHLKIYLMLISWNLIDDLELRVLETHQKPYEKELKTFASYL